ncbi:MAG: multidrug ABC transporter ATP-binding protein, partial [Telmatospirillum sp.]|nr:multidrug ABC transporter ATP-binding protein [Telmatospirillum sp.]
EEMADRVGVIDGGRLLLVEGTAKLMRKLGKRRLTLVLQHRMGTIPPELADWPIELEADGQQFVYSFDANAEDTGIPTLLRVLGEKGIDFKDLDTSRTSLEDIFVSLVERAP